MQMRKYMSLIISIILIFSTVLTGCNTNKKEVEEYYKDFQYLPIQESKLNEEEKAEYTDLIKKKEQAYNDLDLEAMKQCYSDMSHFRDKTNQRIQEEEASQAELEAQQEEERQIKEGSLIKFSVSYQGHSVDIEFRSFQGMRGTGEEMEHVFRNGKYSSSAVLQRSSKTLLAYEHTSYIIPFEISCTKTTKGDFTTSLYMFYDAKNLPIPLKNNETQIVADSDEGWTSSSPSANWLSLIFDDVSSLNISWTCGYIVIPHYYTPEYPDGRGANLKQGNSYYSFKIAFSIDKDSPRKEIQIDLVPEGNNIVLRQH